MRILRIFFSLLKLAIFIAIAAWLYTHPGKIQIEWNDMTIETGTGFAALMLFITLMGFAILYHGWRKLLAIPTQWKRHRRMKSLELGYTALNKGLLSVAAGDVVTAGKNADKAVALLPDVALTHLLAAQAAHMRKDEINADAHLALLAQHPEGQLFGLRGQISRAMLRGDRSEAVRLTRLAYQQQPQQPWVIDMAIQMETRQQNWIQAEKILRQALRLGLPNTEKWQKDLATTLIAISDDFILRNDLDAALDCAREALKLHNGWSVAATRVARLWHRKTYRRRAQKTLINAWEHTPHPDILHEWLYISGAERSMDNTAIVEKLVSVNPENYESYYALGKSYMTAKLWGVARQHTMRAIQFRADRAAYRLMADIEQEDGRNNDAVRGWLDKAAEAPLEPQWQCRVSGELYPVWQVLNHQMDFNTITWQTPFTTAPGLLNDSIADTYLETVVAHPHSITFQS